MFEDQRQKMLSWAPGVDVIHVGSTSFDGGLSRGDVDIQIRVEPAGYAEALAAIAPHYVVNPDGYTSEDAASFKDDDLDPPVGLILTAMDGSGDHLWRFRDALVARPDLAAEYSSIKARHHDGSLKAYRADKHLFVRKVIRTREYVELARSLPWCYRPLRLETERLLVFDVQDGDAGRLASFHARNQEHLAPWSPDRPEGWTSAAFWKRRLTNQQAQKSAGAEAHFIWVPGDAPDGDLAGVASLTGISDNGTGACDLTFEVDSQQQDSGLAQEAVEAVLRFAFEVGLHRVRATHAPANTGRASLLRDLGFGVEGYARDYLRVGGAWQDQVLCALVNVDRP